MITPLAQSAHHRAANLRMPGNWAPAIEALEARIAPAVILPGVYTYTDADGDAVKVQVAGGFKSVQFLAADGSDVLASGGDVKSVIVTGAKKDFSLTFADENSADGDGVVQLGVISGPAGATLPVIKGVFTVGTGDGTTFELGGYKGKGFSKGGGLAILGGLTTVVDGSGGLELGKIAKGTVVSLRDGVESGTLTEVKGEVAGTLVMGGAIDSSVVIGKVTGVAEFGTVSGTVTVNKKVSGFLSVNETTVQGDEEVPVPVGLMHLKGALSSKGRVTAGDNLNLQADGVISGVVRVQGNLFLTAAKGLNGAEVTTLESLTINSSKGVLRSTLDIGGRIEVDSQIVGNIKASSIATVDDIVLDVAGSVVGARIATSDMSFLRVDGVVTGSQISAGNDLDIAVGRHVVDSQIVPDGMLFMEVRGEQKSKGGITGSWIGSRESGMDVAVAGSVSNSMVTTGSDSAFIWVGGNWKNNAFTAGFDAEVEVLGNLKQSDFSSGSELEVDVQGAVRDSAFSGANGLRVLAGQGGIAKTQLETLEGDALVESVGSIAKTVLLSGNDAEIATEGTIASSVLLHAVRDVSVFGTENKIAARIGAGRDVNVLSDGAFTGAIRAGEDLVIRVAQLVPSERSGSVAAGLPRVAEGIRVGGDLALQTTGKVKAGLIEVDGNVTELGVGAGFDARLRVGGNLVLGEAGSNVTAIAGAVSARSVIDIRGDLGDADSAGKVAFGKAFKGRLLIGGDLRTDLDFAASVSHIEIAGAVGETPLGDGIAQINVIGSLGTLRTGSVFVRADAGGGMFVDGEGAPTGTLQTTGRAPKVTMTAFA